MTVFKNCGRFLPITTVQKNENMLMIQKTTKRIMGSHSVTFNVRILIIVKSCSKPEIVTSGESSLDTNSPVSINAKDDS